MTEKTQPLRRKLLGHPIIQQVLKSGVGTAFRLGSVGMGMLFSIFAARIVGAEQFGIYVSLLAIATLSATALQLGLPQLLAREIATFRAGNKRLYETGKPPTQTAHNPRILGNITIGLVILLALSTGVSWAFFDRQIALVTTFIALTLCTGLLGSVLFGHERVLRGALSTDIIKPGAALLCLLILGNAIIKTADDIFLTQIFGLSVAIFGLVLMIGLRPFRQGIKHWTNKPEATASFSPIFITGLLLAMSQVLIGATTQVDILILRALEAPEQVSYYFAAARAALVVSFFFGINAAFAEPTLVRLIAEERHNEVETLAIRTARSGLAATLVAVIATAALGPLYLSWYGEGFEQGYPALLIMLVGMMAWALFGPSQNLARAGRLDKELLWITLFSVLINIAVSFTLVPILGLTGAAIGTTVQYLIYGLLLYVLIRRKLGYRSSAFNRILKPSTV
ncbi:MAG: polysaccharide biosynthesis C-terminal domain-containing protein [Pseudomonadota bacterium]